MYLKDLTFKDIDNNITSGKAIKGYKLRSILNKLPVDCLLNTNGVTDNINVLNKYGVQIGYIDIAEDELELFDF